MAVTLDIRDVYPVWIDGVSPLPDELIKVHTAEQVEKDVVVRLVGGSDVGSLASGMLTALGSANQSVEEERAVAGIDIDGFAESLAQRIEYVINQQREIINSLGCGGVVDMPCISSVTVTELGDCKVLHENDGLFR